MGLAGRTLCAWVVGAVLLAPGAVAFAAQATLVADVHVNKALPAVNSGTISNLYVGAGYTALMQFDLGVLPSGTTAAQISKAVLRVYCNRVDTPGLVSVQPVSAAWGEYSVTYASLPALGAAAQVVQVSGAGAYIAMDVTAMVQGWVSAPATNFGVALTAGTAAVQFDSKENDLTGHAAELEVDLVSQGPQGLTGAQGVAGPAGQSGATGGVGPMGPAGPQGLTGATGPAGPVGPAGNSVGGVFSYQGTYSLGTNYAVGDVAQFGGSSYVSLIASNVGNTPGLSPAFWGLLALGATGAVGPQGPQGLAGPTGLAGPAGPIGAAGTAGSAWAPGAPGLVYQGAYSSVTTPALGAVAVWQGPSYASLVASNHGNTPGLSPGQWGVLTAQGPAGPQGLQGPQGVAGAQGLPGSVGPNGPQGPQGVQGIPGQAGAQGLTGATGAQGLSGPMGPQGVAGPVGLNFVGAYSSTVNYGLADGVSYNGAGYVSLVANNHGNTPDQSPAEWALFASAGAQGVTGQVGATGAQGVAGLVGPQGPQGVAGATGATGPQGPAVANYMGNYSAGTSYGVKDAVSFGGSTYISLVPGNVGNNPSVSPGQWAVLVAQGLAGPAGAAGIAGLAYQGVYAAGVNYGLNDAVSYQGSSYISLVASNLGNAPSLSPGQWGLLAVAGAVGATGAAGATGPAGPAGAVGAAGVAGVTGVAGPAGMVYRGGWSGGTSYLVGDAVAFGGTTYIATAAAAGLEPDLYPAAWGVLAQGSAGPSGPAGAAASVTVGTVTTGLAGTQATVTNSGTAGSAVLNFTIPQGATGANGSGGGGAGVGSFLSMYHLVSFITSYYSLSNPTASASEGDSVMTWVPAACTATSLTVFSRQSNSVTVTLRTGVPGSMSDTALACVAASGSSCTVTGSVAVAAGSFVDLSVAGASGTPAGVWTALGCS